MKSYRTELWFETRKRRELINLHRGMPCHRPMT